MPFAISMEDARLVSRLRRGEREALLSLQADWRPQVWAVCRGMLGRDQDASALVQAVWKGLYNDVAGWSAHTAVPYQLAGLVCRVLARRQRLPQPDGASEIAPAPFVVEGWELGGVVAGLPPSARLVLLLDLEFSVPMEVLSQLCGVPEAHLRRARASASWRLTSLGGVDARAWSRELTLLPDYVADDLSMEEAERVRTALEADPALEAVAARMRQAREGVAALLEAVPDAPESVFVAVPAPVEGIGVPAGVLLGLAVVLITALVSLVREPRWGPLLAAHTSAVGEAPGFVPTVDPHALEAALVDAGVPPSRAIVTDWSNLRLKLRGGRPDGTVLYWLDGQPVTAQEQSGLPYLGTPAAVWRVQGALLQGYQLGDTGVVVVREPSIGRTRVFATTGPYDQLLALLAYGMRQGT